MKIVRPVTLTSAMLISSTVAEPDVAPDAATDPAAYAGGTTYALDAKVYLAATHRIYQSLQAGNVGHSPELAASATWWAEVSGTNRWAMFDNGVASATLEAVSPLTVVFDPGIIDSLVLIGCVGNTATITITDGAGGPTVYGPIVLDLLAAATADWYAYYFEPFRQVPAFVLTDLPPYLNARVTVSIAGDTTAACGMCIPGRGYTIGDTQYEVRVGIRDYSRKLTDETTGLVTLEQRKFAKTLQAQVRIDQAYYAEVQDILESIRATPVVWIADKTGDITPLTVFGFYKDVSLLVDLPTAGMYSIEIEGMV